MKKTEQQDNREPVRSSLVRALGYLEDVETLFRQKFGVVDVAEILNQEQRDAVADAIQTCRAKFLGALSGLYGIEWTAAMSAVVGGEDAAKT